MITKSHLLVARMEWMYEYIFLRAPHFNITLPRSIRQQCLLQDLLDSLEPLNLCKLALPVTKLSLLSSIQVAQLQIQVLVLPWTLNPPPDDGIKHVLLGSNKSYDLLYAARFLRFEWTVYRNISWARVPG